MKKAKTFSTQNKITEYKGYVISTESGIEKGIFLRNPIQNIMFEFDVFGDYAKFSAYKYIEKIKNPIRALYEILIGNGKIVKDVSKWSKENDIEGFHANILCCPIYFKRKYRKLDAKCTNQHSDIRRIVSFGYESEFENCAGGCELETTIIKIKTIDNQVIKRIGTYHFTYEHIVKQIIDSGMIDTDRH